MTNLVKSKAASSDKNRWATTWECFWRAQELFGKKFNLDVCAEMDTTKCSLFIGPPSQGLDEFVTRNSHGQVQCVGRDALVTPWRDDFWCNPPFDLKREFIDRAANQSAIGLSGMMLLPYEPCTKWFRELVMPHADTIYVPDSRYNFLEVDGVTKKTGVNFPSCFVLWTPHYNGGNARIVNIER